MNKFYLLGVLLAFSQPALTDVKVTFTESAPKDRFTVLNVGSCALEELIVNIDLSDSVGGLIFDTTASGAGVEVFQPFEAKQGAITLLSADTVDDGDNQLSIGISKLDPGESVSFTIDVDDTLTNSALGNIRVAGGEMQNSSVEIAAKSRGNISAVFNDRNTALVVLSDCGS